MPIVYDEPRAPEEASVASTSIPKGIVYDNPAPVAGRGIVYDTPPEQPEAPSLLDKAGTAARDFLTEQTKQSSPISQAIGRVADAAGTAAGEALQTNVPLGRDIVTDEEAAKISKYPVAGQAAIAGAAGLADAVQRGVGALFSGGVEGAKQAIRETGLVPETEVQQLGTDLETYLVGKGGEVPSGVAREAAPVPREVTQQKVSDFLYQVYKKKYEEMHKIGPEGQLTGPAGSTAQPGAATTAAPIPPTVEPAPFPNAATEDMSTTLDFGGIDFATPPEPGAIQELPGMVERPAFNRPGGPEKTQKGIPLDEGTAALEKTLENQPPIYAQEVRNRYDRAATPEEKAAIVEQAAVDAKAAGKRQQREGAAALRAGLEDLKTRKAELTDREKFELALEDQKNAEIAKQLAPKKPTFTVIEGGKPPEKPPGLQSQQELDPSLVPMLPPEIKPQAALPASLRITPRPTGFSLGMIGKTTQLGGIKAITFGTPADVEQWIPQVGERNVDLVKIKADNIPHDSITARVEDLPTGAGEGSRVTGGTVRGRMHLRAAVDLVKIYNQRMLQGEFGAAKQVLDQAKAHYGVATDTGVRVTPSTPHSFVMLNPGEHGARMERGPALGAPRTTRTKATHYFVPDMEDRGLVYFSMDAPRLADFAPGLAIDLGKLKDSTAATALPWEAGRNIRSTLATISLQSNAALLKVLTDNGIYFLKPPTNDLIQATARFFQQPFTKPAWNIPEFKSVWGKEFSNLLQRGMRISVTPQTRNFIVIKEEAERAGIPGVTGIPERQHDPGYTAGRARKAQLEVYIHDPYDTPLPREVKTGLRNLARITKVKLRQMGIKIQLEVVPVTSQRMKQLGAHLTTDAAMEITELGKSIIYVNVERVWDENGNVDKLRLLSSYAHEVGHVIIEYVWPDLPYALQDQLLTLVEREYLANAEATNLEMRARSYSPPIFAQYGFKEGPATENPYFFSYFNSTAEAIARAIERYAVGELHGASRPLASWLGRQKGRLDVLYKAVREYDKNFMEPAEAITALADHLRRNPDKNGYAEETLAHHLEKALVPSGTLALPGIEHPSTGATVSTMDGIQQAWGGGGLPPIIDGPIKQAKSAADWIAWQWKKGFTIGEIANANKAILPEGLEYLDEIRQWASDIAATTAKTEVRFVEWKKLGVTEGDKLAKLLFYMSQMDYRTPLEKTNKVRRQPTKAEFLAALRHLNIADQQTITAYDHIRQDFKDHLLEKAAGWASEARRLLRGDPVGTQAALDEIDAKVQQLLNSPYFPMTRFGDYYFTVRDNRGARSNTHGQVVFAENFATAHERDQAATRALAQYPASDFTIHSDLKMSDENAPYIGMPRGTLEKIKDKLDFSNRPDLEREFEAIMYELGPENSMKKHWLVREGIPGYSMDAMRVYADYFMYGNRATARERYNPRLQNIINRMRDRARQQPVGDEITKLAKLFQDNLDDAMNPANDYNLARGFMFHMALAYLPKSALVNLMQLPMVSLPHLQAAYGHVKAPAAVAKAIGTAGKNLKSLLTNNSYVGDPVLAEAMVLAYKENTLRDGIAADLANVATGAWLSRYSGRGRATRALSNFIHHGGDLFSATETFGRQVTYMAAYALAKAGANPAHVEEIVNSPDYRAHLNRLAADPNVGLTEEQIKHHLAATHAVRTTYFETGRWAKPRMLRGKTGVYFMFWTISRAILHFMATQKGGLLALFYLALFAGLSGLPGADDMNNLIKQTAGLIWGKDVDLQRMIREYIVGLFGKTSKVADYAMHGLSSHGMGIPAMLQHYGIPFPDFDVSSSLSLGRLLPGLSDIDLRSGLNPRELIGDMARRATGFGGAQIYNFLSFLYGSGLSLDDPKRLELVLPNYAKFPLRALRWAYEGMERTKIGGEVVKWDMNNGQDRMDVAFSALGFQPNKLTNTWERTGAKLDAKQFYTAQEALLRTAAVNAMQSGDAEDFDAAMDEIAKYNDMVQSQGISSGIDLKGVKSAFMNRLQNVAKFNEGMPMEKKFTPLYEKMDQIYGGGQSTVIDRKQVK